MAAIAHGDLAKTNVAPPKAWGAVPSPYQIEYQVEHELAAFIHFNINAFTGKEWGDGTESPSQFRLEKDFDAERIVKALKDAGFRKIILTVKHHDGFCIWQTKYTEHSIKNSPYKNGKGDILAELSAACTRYDVDMGIYMSPWDQNAKAYGYYDADGNILVDSAGNPREGLTWEDVYRLDVLDYNDYFNKQIVEIVSNPAYGNNGVIKEWWLDGAIQSGYAIQHYDNEGWYKTIQSYQGRAARRADDCLQFQGGNNATVYWIGNESGHACYNTWCKLGLDKNGDLVAGEADATDKYGPARYATGDPLGEKWVVPEADARSSAGWFWDPTQIPKPLKELGDMYFRSVGHGAVLLLNFPPNSDGTLDEGLFTRLAAFGAEVKDLYRENYASPARGATATASEVRGNSARFSPMNVLDDSYDTYWTVDDGTQTGSLEVNLGGRVQFDVVSIREYIPLGQRINGWRLYYRDGDADWVEIEDGGGFPQRAIGPRRLVRMRPVWGTHIRFEVIGSYAEPAISSISVHKAGEGFALGNAGPEGFTFIDAAGLAGEDGMASFSFTGQMAWLVEGDDCGGLQVSVDGGAPLFVEANTTKDISGKDTLGQRVWQTPLLPIGEHTVKVAPADGEKAARAGAPTLGGAWYVGELEAGLYELDAAAYEVAAGEALAFTVSRTGRTDTPDTILLADEPGTAVQGQYYESISKVLEFAPGETSKAFALQTYMSEAHKPGAVLQFGLRLTALGTGALPGLCGEARVSLRR